MVDGLCELVLVVHDLPACIGFYRDTLGLTLESEPSEGWAWFWTGAPHASARLALTTGPLLFQERSPRSPAWGPVHFALRVERADLEPSVQRLRDHGHEVLGPTRFDWMGALSYYVYDPGGNLAELWSPDP